MATSAGPWHDAGMKRDHIAILAAFVVTGAFIAAVAMHWITFGVEVTPVANLQLP
jgi:hypothetical protein